MTGRARAILYSGSFDPLTNGHVDVASRAAMLAERLVVAIGIHSSKAPVFSAEERAGMIRDILPPVLAGHGTVLEVVTFDGLVVEAARRAGAALIARGLRDGTDFDYEIQMSSMNETMEPAVRTVFLPASPAVRPVTATLVRQIAAMGGDVSAFVPPLVAERLRARFARPPS